MDQSQPIIVMRRSVGTLHFAQSSTQPTNHDLNEDGVGGDDEQLIQLVIHLFDIVGFHPIILWTQNMC